MTRPAGPLPVFATDDTYDDAGKPWDGQTNKVSLSAGELAQGFKPSQRLPAEKLGWKLNATDRWLSYLDGIEAKNWDAGLVLASQGGAGTYFGTLTAKTILLSDMGVSGYEAGGAGTGFTFYSASAFATPKWKGHKSDDGGTGSTVHFPLELPDGTVVTGFAMKIIGSSGHTNLPEHMPIIRLIAADVNGAGVSLGGVTEADDATGSVGTYKTNHVVGVSGTEIELDRSSNHYWISIEDEWGTNSQDPSIEIVSVSVTIRDTATITVYADPPALYFPTYASKAVTWNPVTKSLFAVLVRDRVTAPVESSDGRQWSDMGGLDAPTRSTVNLTLTATASGSVTAGDAYSDGTHVWTLDGGHSWSGSGSKGPYAATIYSPGSPAYYGPVEAASGTITTILTPNANVSAVTNASDAATGTAHFGGDGSSVAVDSLGGLLFNASGTLLYRFGPSASGGHAYGDIIGPSPAIDEAYKFYRIIADGNGTKFGAAGITSVGTPHPSLWYLTPSNTAAPASNEETLPNASSYTTDAAFVAVSPTAVVFVSVDGSVTSTWTASGFGDVYTEHGTPSPLTGQTCVALEWSPTDSLFVMATHSGNIFTSSGGVVWQNPGTAGLTIQHMAILGGSWLVKGTFAGVDKLAWSGDQGLTWQVVQVPWTGGDVVSLVALKDCFGVLWVGDDGTAKLYRSLVV